MNNVLSYPRSRGPAVKASLEVAGLNPDVFDDSVRHVLFLPVKPRLVSLDIDFERQRVSFTEGAEDITWDELRAAPISAQRSLDLLWGLIRLVEASPDDVLAFAEQWGVLERPPPPDRTYLPDNFFRVDNLIGLARKCNSLLLLLSKTANGTLAEPSLLNEFLEDEERADLAKISIPYGRTSSAEERSAYDRQARRRRWQEEIAAGRGLALQRRLLALKLGFDEPGHSILVWDDKGRRLERRAEGVREIALTQIRAILSAPEEDVYICSICKWPYLYNPEVSQRRPRSGKQSFCGEECRAAAKREARRESWHRNQAKWRPSSSRKGERSGETPS